MAHVINAQQTSINEVSDLSLESESTPLGKQIRVEGGGGGTGCEQFQS